jgi:hypothetical protein
MFNLRSLRRGFAVLTASLLLAQTALAGLPLVCNPFSTPADAKLLPWAEPAGRFTIDRHYAVENLATDTLRLLTPETSLFARMENLRRASAYATLDRQASNALLRGLLDRAAAARPSDGSRAAALAWFDAGYLIESYRQYGMTHEVDLLANFDKARANRGLRESLGAMDGYLLVQKAIAITHEPEMEYAAALMNTKDGAASARHRENAKAAAKEGSLLATNLKNG